MTSGLKSPRQTPWTGWVLALYGLAASLSVSAMGLFSTLLLLTAAIGLVASTEVRAHARAEIGLVALATAWVLTQALHLGILPWDDRSAHTFGRLPLLLVPAAAALVARGGDPKSEERLLLRLGVGGLVVAVAWALVQYIQTRGPVGGFLKNSIYWAYSLLALGIFFGRIAFRRDEDRSLARLALIGFGAALLGSLLALNRIVPLCLVLFALLSLPRRRAAAVFAIALLVGGVLYATSPFLQAKVERSLNLLSDPSFEWRRVAWGHNWDLFRTNFWFGVGPEKNGLDPALHPHVVGHWTPGHLYFAHNVFLQTAAESGLVGLALFYGFFVAFARRYPASRPLLAFSALGGLFENTWNNSKALHGLLFAMAAIAYFDRSRDVAGEGRA